LLARLEANINYYLTNYVLLCAFILVYAVLSKPLLVIVIIFLAFGWNESVKHPELRFNIPEALQPLFKTNILILKGQQKLMIMGGVTALIILITAGTTIFMVAGISSCIVILHAGFHAAYEGDENENGTPNETGTLTSIAHAHIVDDLESGNLFHNEPLYPKLPENNEDENHTRRLGKQAIEMTSTEISRK